MLNPEQESDFADSRQPMMVDWRRQLHILWERRSLLLVTAGAVISLTLLWLWLATPIYQATAQILVESETMKVLNIQDVVSTDARDLQYVNTQVRILQSPTLMRQAAEAMKLSDDPRFLLKKLPPTTALGKAVAKCLTGTTELLRRLGNILKPEDLRCFPKKLPPTTDLAEELDKCLTITADRTSRLITIRASHRVPDLTAQLANGLAEEYIHENLNRRLTASLETATWLQQQAEEIKPKLAKSEATLLEYREANHAVSLEERQNIVVDKLKALSADLTQAHTERLAAEAEWKTIQAALTNGRPIITIPLIAADTQVKALQAQLNEKQVALASQRERYKAEYPTMVTAQAELRELTERLAAAGTASVEAAHGKYQLAKSKEDSLATALQEQEQQALNLDRILTGYNALKRNAEADRQLYDSIITRMKETSVAGKLETSNTRLVDPATPPRLPARPRKLLVLALGTILGLMGGVFLCFLTEHLNEKIKSYEDLESLGVAVLGVVSKVQFGSTNTGVCLTQTEPQSLAAEHFRDLRASLVLSSQSKQAKVLLITSTIPGEGKTFITTNLSAVFAHSGERTLIVDADLRNPNQQRSFAVPSDNGLSAYLGSNIAFETIVQPTNVPNLDIIPAGRVPTNPHELLGSSRMQELLAVVRQRYDRILIDTPPVSAVSDALILLPKTDGVLFVVQFGTVTRDFIVRTLQKLQNCNANLLGAVLNNVELKRYRYYYPYHGRYTERYAVSGSGEVRGQTGDSGQQSANQGQRSEDLGRKSE